jgi:NADPH:quinone reductase-like Zn-dependent oxidoreductase
VNGATGSAGRLAVGIARHLGAGKIIASGRNETELQELLRAGADVVISFSPGTFHPLGGKKYEQALKSEFSGGIHVVVDYLWGESARAVIAAIAETVEDATPVRFVHTGGASGEASIDLLGAALRSSSIQLMGSGIKSVPMPKLLESIRQVFAAVGPANLWIVTRSMPLAAIEEAWAAPGKPRVVMTL